MSKKDYKKEISFSPKGEDKLEDKLEDKPVKNKPFTGKLNDPNVPMRRKNRILGDGKDWFDTHPDA
tara:strand:+ start:994 stop:1191 length:198 start_codon:yes stop_codon:yes gene_type:complete